MACTKQRPFCQPYSWKRRELHTLLKRFDTIFSFRVIQNSMENRIKILAHPFFQKFSPSGCHICGERQPLVLIREKAPRLTAKDYIFTPFLFCFISSHSTAYISSRCRKGKDHWDRPLQIPVSSALSVKTRHGSFQ